MARGALVFDRRELCPGADVAVSVLLPIETKRWLRPVNRACLVGAHHAVVWKRVYFSPRLANFSAFGVLQGPPKALEAPKPMSSKRMTRTLGAPSGGRSGSIPGNRVSGSFAS